MATPELILSIARRHQKAKRYREAQALYEQLLATHPKHHPAAHQLGIVMLAQGATEQALRILGQVSTLHPDQPDVLGDLGEAYTQTGRLEEAFTCLSRAAFLAPRTPRILFQLGSLMLVQNKPDSAANYFSAATSINPEYVEAHLQLGVANVHLERFQEAANNFAVATQLAPDNWEAFSQLGLVLYILGDADAAQKNQETALLLNPENPILLNRLAELMCKEGQWNEALPLQQKLVAMMPGNTALQLKVAQTLFQLGRLNESATICYKILSDDTSNSDATLLLGKTQFRQGNPKDAQRSFETLIAHNPNHADTLLELSRLYLSTGQPELAKSAIASLVAALPQRFEIPIWDGSDLNGKTLFLYSAFKSFDVVQFMGHIAPLAPKGIRVVVECPPPLADIVGAIDGVASVWTGQTGLTFDAHCPLELLFTRGDATSIVPVPATKVPRNEPVVARMAQSLTPTPHLRVGIMWRHEEDRSFNCHRSVPLSALATLFKTQGVQFVCIQYQTGLEELIETELENTISIPNPAPKTLAESLALIQTLDLFICADTLLAQLAANSQTPVWMMLPQSSEWFWQVAGTSTQWCSNATLYRQTTPGDWLDVANRMVKSLQEKRNLK